MSWNVSMNTTDNVKLTIEPPIINRKNIPEIIRNILKLGIFFMCLRFN
jgi:hypothetical protein